MTHSKQGDQTHALVQPAPLCLSTEQRRNPGIKLQHAFPRVHTVCQTLRGAFSTVDMLGEKLPDGDHTKVSDSQERW